MNDDETAILQRVLTPQAQRRLAQIGGAYPQLKGSIEKQLLALARGEIWNPRKA